MGIKLMYELPVTDIDLFQLLCLKLVCRCQAFVLEIKLSSFILDILAQPGLQAFFEYMISKGLPTNQQNPQQSTVHEVMGI